MTRLPPSSATGPGKRLPTTPAPANPPTAGSPASPPSGPISRQLLLDLGTPPPATFDNFIAGPNTELVSRLLQLRRSVFATPDTQRPGLLRAADDRVFYVWGESGSGRSHLLHALCNAGDLPDAPAADAQQRVRLLTPQSPLSSFGFDPHVTLYAIDDCDRLPPARQIAVFNLFNEIQADPKVAFVATGGAPPRGLTIRDDLRTRLGWGLVYRLAPLNDDEKMAALQIAARDRGFALAPDVPPHLLHHYQRDMPSLKRLLDALGQFALERKRAITLPLLRAMLADTPDAILAPAAAAPVQTAKPLPSSHSARTRTGRIK